jgi:hypothetical protein
MTPAQVFACLDAAVVTNMWHTANQAATITQVAIIPLDGVSATQFFPTSGTSKWQGTGVGTDWDPNTAGLVAFATGLRGRKNRGRIFIPFTDENRTTGGNFPSSIMTAMTAAWTTFGVSLTAGGHTMQHVVASYDRAHGGAGAAAHTVIAYNAEIRAATIRRRLRP